MDLKQTASASGRMIESGQVSPEELTEAYLDAAAKDPLTSRIYARLMPERARAEAAAAGARARAGTRRGLLDGVPLSWKDLFDTADALTEAGSALLAGRQPGQDALVLQRASQAGAVCLGKTHLSELAFSGLGLNPVTATPPCVNDLSAVAGGSSSGAATSVAFGLAPAAIGSDTGGSVRIPAAWNDLVGFKTTHGWLPLDGVVPLAAHFDTVGPLTRSVEDAAEIIGLLSASAAPDLRGASLAGATFARLTGLVESQVRDKPAQGHERAVARLSAAGARIVDLDLPLLTEVLGLAGTLVAAEAYATWKTAIEAAPERMFQPVLDRFRGGAQISAVDYISAWQRLEVLRKEYAAATQGFDAVILPTSAILPPNAARLLSDKDYFATENLLALRNTRIGNLLNLCAVTLPTGVPSTGISLWAGPGHDLRLLRLAAAAERALA